MNFSAISAAGLIAASIAVSAVSSFAACGGDAWTVPKDHFDGVNQFGYVTFWDKIADVDIGEDQPFPIVIGFQSAREKSSPYLGYGWVMPLLESYMVQTGENTFEIMKPTGYTSGFGRDPKTATAIGGVQGWKGEIGSNTIKVWAPCGWSLTYTMGRLTEMGTPKGKRILVKRDLSGQVEDVTMDGRVLVKVVKGLGGKIEGLEVEGQKLAIAMGEKPRVQNLAGKNVIAGKDMSLASISTGEASPMPFRAFEYGVDKDLQPKMVVKAGVQSGREIVWNAGNSIINKDGDWDYDGTAKTEGKNASIRRTNQRGELESWYLDQTLGTELSENSDGTKRKVLRFASGSLVGKIRREEIVRPGLPPFKRELSYDKDGKLAREIRGELVRRFFYDKNKLTITDSVKDNLVRIAFQVDRKPVRETWISGDVTKTWIYKSDDEFSAILGLVSSLANPQNVSLIEVTDSKQNGRTFKYLSGTDGWTMASSVVSQVNHSTIHCSAPHTINNHEKK